MSPEIVSHTSKNTPQISSKKLAELSIYQVGCTVLQPLKAPQKDPEGILRGPFEDGNDRFQKFRAYFEDKTTL